MARLPTHVNICAPNNTWWYVMASPPVIQDPAQSSRRAKIRIGVAVALLVSAVGILAVLNQRKPTPEPLPAETEPATQESISSQEVEKPAGPESIVVPEPSPPPASPAELPAPPVPGKLPATTVPPATAQQAVLPAEETGMSKSARPSPPPAETALIKQKPVVSPPTTSPEKPAIPKEFEVQLGVFGDMENAKQLQAKLAAHGIPSHTETRVQVGPFKSREEAEQTRAKLKSLGISAVIAPK